MNKSTCLALWGTILLASLAGCSEKPGLNFSSGASSAPTETRIFYDNESCAFDGIAAESPILLALAATAIPALVSAGTNVIGDFLAAQAAPEPANTQLATNLYIENGKYPVCVQVVRGRFKAVRYDLREFEVGEIAPMPTWFGQEMAKATRDDGTNVDLSGVAWSRLIMTTSRSGVMLMDWPDAILEVAIRRSSSGGAIAWAPTFVSFDKPSDSLTLRSNSRNQSLTIAIFGVGKKELMSTVDFGETQPGSRKYLNTAALNHFVSLSNLRAQNRVSVSRLNNATLNKETPWLVPEIGDNGPASIRAVYTESKDKDAFLALMSSLFKKGKDTLDKGVSDYALGFLPKQPDPTGESSAAKEYSTNYSAALAGLDECAKLPVPTSEEVGAQVALASKMRSVYALQLAANISAAKAKAPAVFEGADLITPGKGPKDCAAALKRALAQTIKVQ